MVFPTATVQREEEYELLRGTGTNQLVGLQNAARGINITTKGASEDNTSCLARVISQTRGSSWLEPDTVIMHPDNWLSSRLLRDGTGGTVGQYLGGGPFTGAYGVGVAPGMFGGQMLWNKPVVLSTIVGSGTALVGSFRQGAQIMRRGGPTIEATNSGYIGGADLFTTNQVAIRSESRLALCVYRPGAFTEVRGLT